MKKFILFFFFMVVFFPKTNWGCSCASPNTFCESISDGNGTIYAEIILRGKIIGGDNGEKEIKVKQVIYGNVVQNKIIITPSFCTIYFGELENDNEYIFALTKYEDNYHPIGCAIFALKIENNIVKGKIAPGINSIRYKDLNTLKNCGNAFEFFTFENAVSLFPNPTIGEINIKNNSTTESIENIKIRIFNTIGQELPNQINISSILPEETWKISIQDLTTGVYIIKLLGKYQEHSFKIVKI